MSFLFFGLAARYRLGKQRAAKRDVAPMRTGMEWPAVAMQGLAIGGDTAAGLLRGRAARSGEPSGSHLDHRGARGLGRRARCARYGRESAAERAVAVRPAHGSVQRALLPRPPAGRSGPRHRRRARSRAMPDRLRPLRRLQPGARLRRGRPAREVVLGSPSRFKLRTPTSSSAPARTTSRGSCRWRRRESRLGGVPPSGGDLDSSRPTVSVRCSRSRQGSPWYRITRLMAGELVRLAQGASVLGQEPRPGQHRHIRSRRGGGAGLARAHPAIARADAHAARRVVRRSGRRARSLHEEPFAQRGRPRREGRSGDRDRTTSAVR